MINANGFDDLVDDAIRQLSSDDVNAGADCLVELAQVFAKAGCGIESFYNMRKFIIEQAIERTDAMFIDIKLNLAEKQLRESRNGNRKIIVH